MKYNNSKGTVVLGIDLAKQSFQLHGVDTKKQKTGVKNKKQGSEHR